MLSTGMRKKLPNRRGTMVLSTSLMSKFESLARTLLRVTLAFCALSVCIQAASSSFISGNATLHPPPLNLFFFAGNVYKSSFCFLLSHSLFIYTKLSSSTLVLHALSLNAASKRLLVLLYIHFLPHAVSYIITRVRV